MEWTKVTECDFKDIIYEKTGGIARITINRPDRLNAFTDVTCNEMVEALNDANYDPAVGVIVLTGAGDRAFSTGGDVRAEAAGGLRHGQRPDVHGTVRKCLKPVIAAVKGYAIGGGNHLAYCCDLTIAADNAIFGQNGPRVGSPADSYVVPFLVQVVGAKKAKEMWLLCRRYDAQQALEMGLVNSVVPLDKFDEEVEKWCQEILALSPTSLAILKARFDSVFEHLRGPIDGYIQSLVAPDYYDSEESKEGQQAFFEKRRPDFGKFRKPKTS